VADEYATDVHRWWHLSEPSPELVEALDDGWLPPSGRVLDLGCGLGSELALLASRGFEAVGVDQSSVAISRAREEHPGIEFLVADVLDLPFDDASFDVVLDRGCFHYLEAPDRPRYEQEAWRVLRTGGRFLLRACLNSAGMRNDVPDNVVDLVFARWHDAGTAERMIPSDRREMPAIVARLEKPRP
jgi:SAM-dependent methyltransferase